MKDVGIINVVDVESTCWKGNPPPGEKSEIIEIGLCELDSRDLTIGGKRSVLCQPIDSIISPFCTQLTTLTDDKLRVEGVPFGAACTLIRTFHKTRDRIWASFGDYDRRMFAECCARYDVVYPFGPRHLNVKTLASLAFGWRHEFGMEEVLRRLGLPLVGIHHRGGDDAANIAVILREILLTMRGRI